MSVSVFAERLRNAMNSRGLKQVDLVHAAEHRGVKMGKSHISQYVAGKTMPREDVLEFLASELDVDMNWLRGEESTTQLNSDASNSVTDGEHAATPLATGASKPQTDSEIPVGRRRTFGKSHKLDNVLYDVRGPVADEAMRMEANGTHILKLNIGNPAPFGFRTPDEVVYDMAHQLTDTEGYSPSKGLFSARKAIMQYAQLKNIPNVTIDDIYTGNGVSELINLSMSALVDTNSPNGIRTSTTSAPRSPATPRRLSSSTRTTPPAHFTQRKCSSRSSTSRASTSSSSSPTKSTIASSWTACSTSPSPRWPRTCSA